MRWRCNWKMRQLVKKWVRMKTWERATHQRMRQNLRPPLMRLTQMLLNPKQIWKLQKMMKTWTEKSELIIFFSKCDR